MDYETAVVVAFLGFIGVIGIVAVYTTPWALIAVLAWSGAKDTVTIEKDGVKVTVMASEDAEETAKEVARQL